MQTDSAITEQPKAVSRVHSEMRVYIGIFLAVFVICIGYAGYTNHAWEDWYITFRASKNLANGDGLTFTQGERVYSFTSPLGTVVPALCSRIAGRTHDSLALWYYRLFSASLLGLACVLLYSVLRRSHFQILVAAVTGVAFMFESKIVDHTINGMETGLMLFFLALTVRAHTLKLSHLGWQLGLAWGGLMWTRPDGCIYGAAVAAGFLVFNPGCPLGVNRRDILFACCKALAVASLIYLPWLIGTWIYYGSPIPHTITAKSFQSSQMLDIAALPKLLFTLPFRAFPDYLTAAEQALVPSYARVFAGWPEALFVYSRVIVSVASYYWLVPRASRLARALSLTTLLLNFYLTDITPHAMPWYLPNLAVFVFLSFGAAINDVLHRLGEIEAGNPGFRGFGRTSATLIACVPAFVSLGTFPHVAQQSRLQQRLVEDGVRTVAGIYLKEHALGPKDTVMAECLGYLGFFSGLKMYDYPGMGTPEMVAARRKLAPTHGPYLAWGDLTGEQLIALTEELQPDWLVIRPAAAKRFHHAQPEYLATVYNGEATVSTREAIEALPDLPGRGFLLYDATFYIFRRVDRAEPASPAEQP